MRPFEYEITKANKKPNKIVNSIVPNLSVDGTIPHEHDYESFINAYRSWVYIACTKNAVAVASQPLRLYAAVDKSTKIKSFKHRELEKSEYLSLKSKDSPNISSLSSVRKSDRIVEILEHPFLDLMNSVNNFMNMFDLFEITTLYEDLTGNSYWYILDNKLGIPKEIWPVMPQDMKIIPDKKSFISGYEYQRSGNFGSVDKVFLQEKEVIHFKHISPKSYYYGYSPVWAVRDAYNTGMNMYTYENALFLNGGTLSGVFQTDADLSEYEFERLKEEIKQMFGGAANAGKAPLLSNGVSYNPYGLPPKEMSYLKGRTSLKEEIVNCFVPETKVIMKDGIKYIEDIVVGDEVLTHNGVFRKVLKTFKRKYEGEVYSVKAKTLDKIIVTPHHPAFVFESKNDEYNWKHIEDLNFNDNLAFHKSINIRIPYDSTEERGDYFIFPLEYKEKSTFNGYVYNIEVEEDNSYVTTGGTVHNCLGQNLSMYSQEANRANSDNAFAEFARNAVRPRLIKIEQKLNEKLLPRYDARLFVKFDNPVPEDVQFKLEERIKNVQSGIVSINEARDDMHMKPIKGLEKPIIPVNYQTVEALLLTSVPPPAPVVNNINDNSEGDNQDNKPEKKPKEDQNNQEEKPKK